MNSDVKKQNAVEILAPVGSWEALTAAINAGCNSIYFGIEQLNMRARSSINFTMEDMKTIAQKCSAHNVKTYITLNTIMYDHDMALMRNIVDTAKKSGITAVIASDHAVMTYAKKVGIPVHISTQTNVTNIETVEFYAAFADVMVLSRELSLRQVAYITNEINRRNVTGPSGNLVRIEIFAHGALCMAVSGKCYLSLHTHNASANRGACIQNCRRDYVVIDKQDNIELEVSNEYIMSAKDLCTIGFLDKIVAAGVHILKIEGRGRAADYVDITVSCYKQAADAVANGSYTDEKIAFWTNELSRVFNRGFWDGYYLGRKMGEWNNSYGSKATETKSFVGKGVKYFKNIQVGEFALEAGSLSIGDTVLISGPTTGVLRSTITEMRVAETTVTEVNKGDIFSMPIDKMIRPSDKLYKVTPA